MLEYLFAAQHSKSQFAEKNRLQSCSIGNKTQQQISLFMDSFINTLVFWGPTSQLQQQNRKVSGLKVSEEWKQ